MANNPMMDDLEFENRLNDMGDNQLELIKFVARQQNSTGKTLVSHGKRLRRLEGKNFRLFGFVGLTGAVLGTAITATIDYLLRRG